MWFDGQAREFDDSAGLEPEVGRRVAEAIVTLSSAAGDDLILDIGAGTGTIGCHFQTLPHRYVALEHSREMLSVFQRKVEPLPSHMLLVEADGDESWPVADRSAKVVFASRVIHHLNLRHFLEETARVACRGGCLLFGSIKRDPDSLPNRLKQRKRTLLVEHGLSIGSGDDSVRQVLDAACAMGATALPATTVAHWTRTTTPREILNSWEGKPQLTSSAAGRGMSPKQREATVNTLREWTLAEYGDLDHPQEFTQEYVVRGVTWNQIS
jgi:predicted TPR repeat methyltransferase